MSFWYSGKSPLYISSRLRATVVLNKIMFCFQDPRTKKQTTSDRRAGKAKPSPPARHGRATFCGKCGWFVIALRPESYFEFDSALRFNSNANKYLFLGSTKNGLTTFGRRKANRAKPPSPAQNGRVIVCRVCRWVAVAPPPILSQSILSSLFLFCVLKISSKFSRALSLWVSFTSLWSLFLSCGLSFLFLFACFPCFCVLIFLFLFDRCFHSFFLLCIFLCSSVGLLFLFSCQCFSPLFCWYAALLCCSLVTDWFHLAPCPKKFPEMGARADRWT